MRKWLLILLVTSACVQEGTGLGGVPVFDEHEGKGRSGSGLGCLTFDVSGEVYELSLPSGETTPTGLSFPPGHYFGLGQIGSKLVACALLEGVVALDIDTNEVERFDVECSSIDVWKGKLIVANVFREPPGQYQIYDDLDALGQGQFRAADIGERFGEQFTTWKDELYVSSDDQDRILVFDLKEGQPDRVITLESKVGWVTGIELHPAGALIILAASREASFHIFDPQTGKLFRSSNEPARFSGLDCGDS